MSNLHNMLAAIEYQQMLERERAVVQNLHNQGICLGPTSCIICKEHRVTNIVEATLKDRGAEYGDYTNMSQVAQEIKRVLSLGASYPALPYTHRESLDMIATKMARIVCGNPYNIDSWHDIQGYAKKAEETCPLQGGAPAGTATP